MSTALQRTFLQTLYHFHPFTYTFSYASVPKKLEKKIEKRGKSKYHGVPYIIKYFGNMFEVLNLRSSNNDKTTQLIPS